LENCDSGRPITFMEDNGAVDVRKISFVDKYGTGVAQIHVM
jgi:hypothetical protein